MKNIFKCTIIFLGLGVLAGCSINHPVAKDYPQYLSKNGNTGSLPKTDLKTNYALDGQTQNHRYEFRAATVGYAHVWIVEMGKILDATLNAPYVQSSFGRLTKVDGGKIDSGYLVQFTLKKYEFKDYRAHVSMYVELTKGENIILSKTYSEEGDSKGGQMWGAGPFGMKNATLASTKSAIDRILGRFINDIPKE